MSSITTSSTSNEFVDLLSNNRHHHSKKFNQNNFRRPPHPSNPNQPSNRKHQKIISKKSSKPHGALDVIDTLDTIGGFHHDGPFDAASSHRNRHLNSKNPARQAPMAAFDPSALILPSPNPSSSNSLNIPSKNLHLPTITTTNSHQNHFYPPVIQRHSSDSILPVSMGFPAGTIDPKAMRLAEALGIQANEAWEDFAMERNENPSKLKKDLLLPPSTTISRLERDARSASVWDMEQTIKSGKPVPSEPMPPVPQLNLNRAATTSTQLKRSKSLMQRLKKGVKSPNLPIDSSFVHVSNDQPIDHLVESIEELNLHPPSTQQITHHQPINRKTSILGKFGLGKRVLSKV
ncbi:hypothetical protein O181_033107 [Austropuccinia psidii MF-1]|uniref:Uncharacterized protein n=1 Tax=Austropuccinia psidii MF-1 TaxID=1389203 RepID=A0A9Q3H6V2_9BASI|nr:hypothetical protein [Austropuccinia psidii MF-1]